MKNKKIIFFVATVCCLAVSWLCFGAWSMVDTDYTTSSFYFSPTIGYVHIVPSPSITNLSNVSVNIIYTSNNNNMTVGSYSNSLSSMNQLQSNGVYTWSSNIYSVNKSVELAVAISTNNRVDGEYFISSVYTMNHPYDSPREFVSISSFSSNYVRYSIEYNAYRVLIVFVDKVPTNGVSQEQYDELLQRYEDLEYDFSDLESDYDDLYIEVQEYIALYNQELAINTALNTRIEELQARIDTLESGGTALDFIGSAFEKVGDILQIQILPNGITIGTIVAIPLILGVVFLVLRLVRGE